MLDFGIARRFRDENSRVKPQRVGYDEFRGSTTYASINALHKQDQGMADVLLDQLHVPQLPFKGSSTITRASKATHHLELDLCSSICDTPPA